MTTVFYPVQSDATSAVLKDRYSFDGSVLWPEETDVLLAERIVKESEKLGKTPLNRIPSKFEHRNAEAITAIPQYQFPAWKTLDSLINFFDIKGGALWIAPAVWEFAWPFHKLCRKHALFAAYGDINNLPVSAEIIRQAKISCLVTHYTTFLLLKEDLKINKAEDVLKLVVLVRDVHDDISETKPYTIGNAQTFFEMQLFPSHTIAFQSLNIAGSSNLFHLSEEYLWRLEEDATYITGMHTDVLPVFNYKLSVVLTQIESGSKLPVFAFKHG